MTEIISDVFSYSLATILVGISGAWIFLIKSMMDTFRLTPFLDRFDNKSTRHPKVSIILPARNEEEFLGKCLDSLEDQDYENYEIVVIDDSSEDGTREIILEHARKSSKIVPVYAKAKPEGWTGKNWACMEGYKQASGDLLLFTDADTIHSKNIITLAVDHLNSFELDALSVVPKMLAFDFWTMVTLPMISTFLHTRFSPLNVNNPAKKTGYFFGSFFILKKRTYESVGMHEGVKHEIIEDGALGRKVKESGHKMKMVRGEHLVEAVWARDKTTLWNALKRLMVPLYLQTRNTAIGIFVAVVFLLFAPFPTALVTSAFLADTMSWKILCMAAVTASILVYIGATIEAKIGLGLKPVYAIFAPLGGLVVSLGFLSGLLESRGRSSVMWRGRIYSMKGHCQSSIGV